MNRSFASFSDSSQASAACLGAQCLGLALVAILTACGSTSLQTTTGGPDLVQIGESNRTIQSLTDLDAVRRVGVGGERVFLATDFGVVAVARSGDAAPRRFTTRDGLPSNNVAAVAVTSDGSAIVATSSGLARISGDSVAEFASAPPVGDVTELVIAPNGKVWVGGVEGVAHLVEGTWTKVGETATVTLLELTTDGNIWVGTTNGLWYLEGDIIREHSPGRGLPEGYVRAIVPMTGGKALALLQGPGDTRIAYYENDRWFSYSLANFEPRAIDLVNYGGNTLLITPGQAYKISPSPIEDGVPLVLLSRSEPRGAQSYRARTTSSEDFTPSVSDDDPSRNTSRAASSLASVPEALPPVEGPAFMVSVSEVAIPQNVYWATTIGGDLYVAARNRGVTRIDERGATSHFRSLDLVRERDLQIAVDAATNTWVIGRSGDVAVYENGSFRRVDAPEGVIPQSIASGPGGAFVLARVGDTSTVRLYRVSTDGWNQEFEQELAVHNGEFLGLPFFALTPSMQVWAGIRVRDEHGERMRGAVFFNGQGPATFFHRAATPETDGEGALAMPDEIEGVDLNMNNYAWFPSLNGAIRVGDSQAIVFGEARGVRGEVVTDLLVGDNERVWMAAAEGLGYYEAQSFNFQLPAVVQQARPIALALDSGSNLWGVGQNGAVYFDGTNWTALTAENGLPTNTLVDIEVDGLDRVWMLAEDQLILFTGESRETP